MDIFDHDDPIDWLQAAIEARKRDQPGFSIRSLARELEIAAGYLSNLLHRQRPISVDMATRLGEAFGLGEGELDYLRAMVAWRQATTDAERAAALVRMDGARQIDQAKALSSAHAEYMEQWYTVVVREMMTMPDFQADPAWIAARVVPPITEAQAAEALEVIRDKRLEGPGAVSTGHVPTREVGVKWRKQMIENAAGLFERFPREDRFATAVIAALPASTVAQIREDIKQFAALLVSRCETAPQPHEQVMVVQIQLFPLTTRVEEPGRPGTPGDEPQTP